MNTTYTHQRVLVVEDVSLWICPWENYYLIVSHVLQYTILVVVRLVDNLNVGRSMMLLNGTMDEYPTTKQSIINNEKVVHISNNNYHKMK